MISYFILGIIIILILLFESTIIPLFFENNVTPDFLMVLVTSWAFLWGEKKGAYFGLFTGLLQDVLFGSMLGFYGLAKMIIGYLAGLISHGLYREQVIGPMVVVFIITFIHDSLSYLIAVNVFKFPVPFFSVVKFLFVPRAIYHFVLILFIYPIIYRVNQKYF